MFIGYLENYKLEAFRAGSKIPLPPSVGETGIGIRWDYKLLLNSSIDIKFTLEQECFVGAISFTLGRFVKIYSAEIISNGKIISKFTAQTGKHFSEDFTVRIGKTLSSFTLRIHNAYSSIEFKEIKISGAYEDGAPLIWPTPKSIVMGKGAVSLGKTIIATTEDEQYAKHFLEEGIVERFGDCLKDDGAPIHLAIDKSIESERITISSKQEAITITSGSKLSLLRGVTMLFALISNGQASICEIDDTPSLPMRGYHMGLPQKCNLNFTKNLFKYILLPLGYNQLFIQLCGGMRYESHPKITEAWLRANRLYREGKWPQFPHDYMGAEGYVLEKDEVSDLFGYARELGFELIPEVQSLGHVQWITNAYPEIGEVDENEKQVEDEREEDLRPDKKFIHCYCPSNERSYEILFDILDETIDVIKPQRYVHIGHDEVYHLGLCEKCRKKSHADLFVGDVMRIYNHLKERGLGTMMWGDMLQPVTKYETKEAIDRLPKDIIQLDFIWYFHFDKDIEQNLLEKGYPVLLGNLYSSHFPRYKKRIQNPGILGGQVSSWCAVSEYAMGKKGKFWELTYTAQLLSNPEAYDDDLRDVFSHIIAKKIQPNQRDLIRGKYSINGYSSKNIPLPCKADKSLPDELIAKRKSATFADGMTIEINGKFDRLAIEHATLFHGLRTPWVPLKKTGIYTVHYEDGSEMSVPAEYAGNVQCINHRYGDPFPEPAHRHTGYWGTWFSDPTLEETMGEGHPLLLTEFILENPKPEATIKSISYKSDSDDFTSLILTGLCGLNKN